MGTKEEARLTMRVVDLSSQAIGDVGVRALVPVLQMAVVTKLYLVNNAISDAGAQCLAEGLRYARGLQVLHLNNNEILDEGAHKIAMACESLPVIATLNLSHNPFGFVGTKSIATFLSQSTCRLKSLALSGCLNSGLPWKTIHPKVASKLKRFGDDGAICVAAALIN
ncbi:unnamed protein product, partial [Chrysoparadoxa australica]